MQVSWIVCSNDGSVIKRENHFIKDTDFAIAPSAIKVHGITHEFLQANGEKREDVLNLLAKDLTAYDPLVIGHFMELDARMIGADFYRVGMDNPLENIPSFCTMRATAHLVRNPALTYLGLFDLYHILFKEKLQNQHDALTDAAATAKCFFELLKRGEINESKIEEQVTYYRPPISIPPKGCSLFAIIILLFIILMAYWL